MNIKIDRILINSYGTLHCWHCNLGPHLHIIFRSSNFINFPLIPKPPKLLFLLSFFRSKFWIYFSFSLPNAGGKMGSTPVSYSGGTGFKLWTRYGYPDWRVSWFSSLPSDKCWANTASFHIVSNTLYDDNPTVWRSTRSLSYWLRSLEHKK